MSDKPLTRQERWLQLSQISAMPNGSEILLNIYHSLTTEPLYPGIPMIQSIIFYEYGQDGDLPLSYRAKEKREN